mmetsp:Transcript_93563/g.166460  ORF Transcript_93563/g.166460 Transcript_93563/m.166460 type:complete len:173 (+) Transcript_93563:136-654(+)
MSAWLLVVFACLRSAASSSNSGTEVFSATLASDFTEFSGLGLGPQIDATIKPGKPKVPVEGSQAEGGVASVPLYSSEVPESLGPQLEATVQHHERTLGLGPQLDSRIIPAKTSLRGSTTTLPAGLISPTTFRVVFLLFGLIAVYYSLQQDESDKLSKARRFISALRWNRSKK